MARAATPAPPSVDAGLPPVDARSAGSAAPAEAAQAVLRPLPIAGPFGSLLASCEHAAPCGGTRWDGKTGEISQPTAKPDCAAVIDPSRDDNGGDGDGHPAALVHGTARGELRLGGVACAVPKGVRGSESQYYVFVQRADGWWRAGPVFRFSYNDKYCGGTMQLRWNDQLGRTFLGIAATDNCLTCGKRGNEEETIELMIRVEAHGARPVVFPPLVVGERTSVRPMEELSPTDCKPTRQHVSMAESWPSADELVLAGPATWREVVTGDGMIEIRLGQDGNPSTAGRYRFTR